MLYRSFRVIMMITSIMGIINMLTQSSYEYIFFPLTIIVWGIFSFFDEEDKEHLRRNGIDPDEVSWFFPEYTDYGYNQKHHRRAEPARRNTYEPTTYTPYAQSNINYTYNNPTYKKLVSKCKRNFKITVSDGKL